MTIAEIYGKLSRSGNNISDVREALLTSEVFGIARYLPEELLLRPFLERSTNAMGKALVVESGAISCAFWPRYGLVSQGVVVEPDVLLFVGSSPRQVLLVEAKLHSGLSGPAQLANEFQLQQQFDIWPGETAEPAWRRQLVFVTADWMRPTALIREATLPGRLEAQAMHDAYWLSWSAAHAAALAGFDSATSDTERTILKDVRDLLATKGLSEFTGCRRDASLSAIRSRFAIRRSRGHNGTSATKDPTCSPETRCLVEQFASTRDSPPRPRRSHPAM